MLIPEATDEDLTDPNLAQVLVDRLPALLEEFKQALITIGFPSNETTQKPDNS